MRYATEAESDLKKEAKQSERYKGHGRRAGKEVATGPKSTRKEEREEVVVNWKGGGGGMGASSTRRLGGRGGLILIRLREGVRKARSDASSRKPIKRTGNIRAGPFTHCSMGYGEKRVPVYSPSNSFDIVA